MEGETCLTEDRFDPAAELARFVDALVDEGAVVSFVGVARPLGCTGTKVKRLFLDHHPRLTQKSLDTIASEAKRSFAVTMVRVVHRFGAVRPGEPIVFTAAASVHRRAAFDAADYMMDRLKTDAVFWKREDSVDGSAWIEPTEIDCARRAHWSD